MKLSVWAKEQGISYKTAWRWWKAGTMPVPVVQLPSGTVIVHESKVIGGGVALYARVSSAEQKTDLDRQLARLLEFAIAQKMPIVASVKEIGSGLDGQRKGMMRLLGNAQVQTILVEHRDRLMRFGFEYVESALAAQDIVRDLHEVIVSMCSRLYGKRSAKNRAQKALDAIHE